MAKLLQELTALLPQAILSGNPAVVVTGITADSRKVTPGMLFICLSGSHTDGHTHAGDAVAKGAVAVLAERELTVAKDATVVKVPDTRTAMQIIVPAFFDYPGRKLRLIGVTGTNGKTTITYLLRSILRQAGFRVGLLGTIQCLIEDETLAVKNTTPDVVELQSILAEMVRRGMDYVVMEASSHALALKRTAGCEFDIGIFTNITQDHLDFHGSFAHYTAAKAELFRSLGTVDAVKTGKIAIINGDDPAGAVMRQAASCPVITYGIDGLWDLRARDLQVGANGTRFTLCGSFGEMPLQLKITGKFNVYNVLAAVGAALTEGIAPAVIMAAMQNFTSVAGRFELVQAGQSFGVIVDYAHTPDSLENVLKTAAEFVPGKIIVVFGCGGDRDRSKRPIMGRVAAQYADVALATSDNPRSEDPLAILAEVELGIKEAMAAGCRAQRYEVIADRRRAITRAIELAQPEDLVMIAGKGHETYQILGDRIIDFDDREVAREIIKEMR